MKDAFEYHGVWWLPNRGGEEFSGNLKFLPEEGATLELMGMFKSVKDIRPYSTYHIIHGVTTNSKLITLVECQENGFSLPQPGVTTSRYSIRTVLIGRLFDSISDIAFRRVYAEYTTLAEWVGISGFTITPKWRVKGVDVKYRQPSPIKLYSDNNMAVQIAFGSTGPSLVPGTQIEASIKQVVYVQFELAKKQFLSELYFSLYNMRNLLSLAALGRVFIQSITGYVDKKNSTGVEVFFLQNHGWDISKYLRNKEMLFMMSDILSHSQQYIQSWREKETNLRVVYDMYFATLYSREMYVEHFFLSMVQACESYHDRITNLKLSLRERLTQIFNTFSFVLNRVVLDRDAFIDNVVITRNYLSHRTARSEARAMRGSELHSLACQLRACFKRDQGSRASISRIIAM